MPPAAKPAKPAPHPTVKSRVIRGENLAALRKLKSASVQLIYIDPPFNTGTTQHRPRIKTVRDAAGDRTGFGGHR